MNPDTVRQEFRKRVCDQISLEPEGIGRYRVVTPFRFDDGDHFGIVLKLENGRWILTDEAHTLMHLSYWLDDRELDSGKRHEILQSSLSGFFVEDRGGEFVIPIADQQYGDALFSFVQALLKVSDISFLSRERVRSTFLEDLRAFLESRVPQGRLTRDWSDPVHDQKRRYTVDFRVNGMTVPLFVYGLQSDAKVKDATINLLTFEHWGIQYRSLGIFEDQGSIQRNTLAKFTDVCDKAFSSLDENKDRIETHLNRLIDQTSLQ